MADDAHLSAILAENQRLRDENAQLRARLANDVAYLRDEIKAERGLRSLSGDSAAMKAVRRAIQQVAPTDSTVLIQGETGTGKGLTARSIHRASARSAGSLGCVPYGLRIRPPPLQNGRAD
jgi:formate hydrogenlyase transcriptional activator